MAGLTKTALERVLLTERHRRQANQTTQAGFSHPILSERALDVALEPLVATNARGELVQTRISRASGMARYAFFDCPLEEEPGLLSPFFAALWSLSEKNGWANRCTSLSEVATRMALGPRSIVVPYGLVEAIGSLSRSECDQLMITQGYISKGEQQVLVGDLPAGCALVAAAPSVAGFYTRVDSRLGLLLTRVDQSIFLVRGAVA